jgi:hypothetical protein
LRQKVLLVVTALAVLAATMPGVAGAAAKKHSSKNADAAVVSVGPGSAKGKGVDATGGKFKFSAKSTKQGVFTPLQRGSSLTSIPPGNLPRGRSCV